MKRKNAADLAAAKALPPPAERRHLRETAGLSQAELAEVVGCSREAITGYELGIRAPTGARRIAYAKALADLKRYVAEAGQ